jgi:DNA-binding transcriptional regulator YiaG
MKTSLYEFANLKYLTLTNVPVRKTAHGEVLDISLNQLERIAAIAIIKNKFPIGGAEVKLFRSVMGLSLASFAEKLGFRDTTIHYWEKNPDKRLSLVNEIAVKLLIGEFLGFELEASVSGLVSQDKLKSIKVSAA